MDSEENQASFLVKEATMSSRSNTFTVAIFQQRYVNSHRIVMTRILPFRLNRQMEQSRSACRRTRYTLHPGSQTQNTGTPEGIAAMDGGEILSAHLTNISFRIALNLPASIRHR